MTVTPLPHKARPRTVGEVVSLTVRHLMVDHDLTQTALAAILGITQPQVSARLGGRAPWSLTDLEVMARYFGVSVAELVGGEPGWTGPHDGGERARRDSNPQPSDPKVVPIRATPARSLPARKVA